MTIKTHRWVADVRVACNLMRNEDGSFFLQVGSGNVGDYPMRVWCYDCETDATVAFGTPCEGYIVPGGKDETWPDSAWEGLPGND